MSAFASLTRAGMQSAEMLAVSGREMHLEHLIVTYSFLDLKELNNTYFVG